MTTQETPADLGDRASDFWRVSMETFELSDSERELLCECARLIDEVEQLHETVKAEGVSVPGSAGQPRIHPGLGELRQHRLALGRLLAQLALPDESDQSLRSPIQARSRQGSQARWGDHTKHADSMKGVS